MIQTNQTLWNQSVNHSVYFVICLDKSVCQSYVHWKSEIIPVLAVWLWNLPRCELLQGNVSQSLRGEFVVYLEEQPSKNSFSCDWLFNWFWQHSWGNNCNVPQKPNPGEWRRSSCVDANKKNKKTFIPVLKKSGWLRTQRHTADRRNKLQCYFYTVFFFFFTLTSC